MLKDCETTRQRPRERIVETARDLFRRHGLRGVGVRRSPKLAGRTK